MIMEKTNPFMLFVEYFKQNKRGLIRLWLVVAGVHFLSLLFGFAIFLIVFGFQIAVRRIIVYWTPGRRWFVKAFDLRTNEYNVSTASFSYKLFVNIFHLIIALLFMVIGLYVVKLGIDILLRDGFLGQNFIYLIFFR